MGGSPAIATKDINRYRTPTSAQEVVKMSMDIEAVRKRRLLVRACSKAWTEGHS